MTGKAGWHRRIHRDYHAVAKRTELTDDIEIDEGATSKIHNAAKNVVLKRKLATIAMPHPNNNIASGSSSVGPQSKTDTAESAAPTGGGGERERLTYS